MSAWIADVPPEFDRNRCQNELLTWHQNSDTIDDSTELLTNHGNSDTEGVREEYPKDTIWIVQTKKARSRWSTIQIRKIQKLLEEYC